MLKIKDNVDLKELEKFGFKHYYTIWKSDENVPDDNEWGYNIEFTDIDKKVAVPILNINEKDRQIREYISNDYESYCIVKESRLNVLYDLIQAGLVEKVVE